MLNSNMTDVWVNSMAYHLRDTYHIAGCCHLVNLLLWFQSHVSRCRVLSFGEINIMNVPHCRVYEFHPPYWKSFFAIFYFILFLMQFGLWRAAAFVSSPIHLFCFATILNWIRWNYDDQIKCLHFGRNWYKSKGAGYTLISSAQQCWLTILN